MSITKETRITLRTEIHYLHGATGHIERHIYGDKDEMVIVLYGRSEMCIPTSLAAGLIASLQEIVGAE
jgi:hypothetical protein